MNPKYGILDIVPNGEHFGEYYQYLLRTVPDRFRPNRFREIGTFVMQAWASVFGLYLGTMWCTYTQYLTTFAGVPMDIIDQHDPSLRLSHPLLLLRCQRVWHGTPPPSPPQACISHSHSSLNPSPSFVSLSPSSRHCHRPILLFTPPSAGDKDPSHFSAMVVDIVSSFLVTVAPSDGD